MQTDTHAYSIHPSTASVLLVKPQNLFLVTVCELADHTTRFCKLNLIGFFRQRSVQGEKLEKLLRSYSKGQKLC